MKHFLFKWHLCESNLLQGLLSMTGYQKEEGHFFKQSSQNNYPHTRFVSEKGGNLKTFFLLY